MKDKTSKVFFPIILITVFILTTASLAVAVLFAYHDKLSPQGVSLFETCSTCWKMGFGAMLGLIGGRSVIEKPRLSTTNSNEQN